MKSNYLILLLTFYSLLASAGGSYPSGDSPTPQPVPTSIPSPSPAPRFNCCVCQYQDFRGCRSATTESDCDSKASGECRWENETCQPRNLDDCEDWMESPEQRNWCDQVAYIPREDDQGRSVNPTGGLSLCREFRYLHEGHGRGVINYERCGAQCIAGLPGCTRFELSDGGCSTFDEVSRGREAALRLSQQLREGQSMSFSANQTLASAANPSRYTYYFDSNGIRREVPQDCGGSCHPDAEGATVFCSTGTGIRMQKCQSRNWVVIR